MSWQCLVVGCRVQHKWSGGSCCSYQKIYGMILKRQGSSLALCLFEEKQGREK